MTAKSFLGYHYNSRGPETNFLALLHLFLFVSLFIPGQTFSAESQSLTVVSYPARPAKLPLWLAQDAGFFEKNGLKVTLKELNSSEELVASIQKTRGSDLRGDRELDRGRHRRRI